MEGGKRDSTCPNMGVTRSRPVAWKTGCGQKKREQHGMVGETQRVLFGTVLERGLTSLFWASERKGEWCGETEGENVKER